MRKRFLLGALMLGLALAISGCGATGGVSQAEYDKVVAERDKYKQLYEEAIGKGDSSNDSSNIEIESVGGDSQELELMKIDLTVENALDYIQFATSDIKNVFGDLTDEHRLFSYSKVFSDGWYYYSCSDDFAIDYKLDDGYGSIKTSPYGMITTWHHDERDYNANSVSVSRVQGSITFVNKNSVESIKIEDGSRKLNFVNGTGTGSGGSDIYKDYPY